MKRTCKTCVYYDTYGNCWNPKETPLCLDLPQPRKSNDPACAVWVLAPGKLTTAFRASLDKAREKHPVFLDAWPKAEDAETYLDTAEIHKLGIGKKDSTQLHSILFSEVFEFLAEVARGDFDRALEEAGDVMAVLYRTLNGDGQKKEEAK